MIPDLYRAAYSAIMFVSRTTQIPCARVIDLGVSVVDEDGGHGRKKRGVYRRRHSKQDSKSIIELPHMIALPPCGAALAFFAPCPSRQIELKWSLGGLKVSVLWGLHNPET